MHKFGLSRERCSNFGFVWLATFVLLLSACSDSDRSVDTVVVDEGPVSTVVTVGGGVTKGPVAGATVNVYAVDSEGQKSAEPIATATTDESGQYTIELTNFTGVYIVEATGGNYVDEATGTSKSIPSEAPLRAVSTIATGSETTTVTASVTPLTEIATQVAEQKSGGLTSDNVTAGNDEVGALFFGSSEGAGEKLLTTAPADITKEDSATASDDERLYGLMVGAISELENQTGSLAEAVAAVATDIAADGNLSDSAAGLTAATNTVISSPTNNSGVTSATRVSNILTAAATGSGTEVAQSSDADITGFRFEDTLVRTINKASLTVSVLQPFETDLAALADPAIAVSLGATVEAEAGEDFTAPVSYIVTAEDGTQATWTVTVSVAESEASPLANITGAASDLITSLVINTSTHSVVGSVATLDDLATLDQTTDPTTIYSVSDGATIQTQSGSYQQAEVIYLVTAEDGTSTNEWVVKLRVNDPQPQPAFSIVNGDLGLTVLSEPVQLVTEGGLPEAALSFSSSDTGVVTVSAEGLLTVAGAGEATVSARKGRVVTAIVEYLPVSTSITVTVSKLEQTPLAFAQASVSAPLNGSVSNALSGGSGSGEITYSSSETSVATVSNDGTVTLVATGSTTISAVKAGDSTYVESNTASYSLTVTEEVTGNCVFDQSNWDECVIQ